MAESFRRQGLVRPRDDRVIAGVCAGLGRRFGLSPWTSRLLFIVVLMAIPGSQIIVYPILWALMRRNSPLGLALQRADEQCVEVK